MKAENGLRFHLYHAAWYVVPVLALLLLTACGGGSGGEPDRPVAQAVAPAIVLDGPYQIIEGTAAQTLRFTLRFEDYFKCADGHAGIMLHASLDGLKTGQYRGVGLIFGQFATNHHNTRLLPDMLPIAVLQTWAVGIVGPEFDPLHVESVSPELHDGVDYPVTVSTEGGFLSYTLGDYVSPKVAIHPAIDLSLASMAYFNATGPDQACPYAIRISNPRST